MKISIIGTGYVGLVSGSCLAYLGHEIICVDNNQEKIDLLNNNIMPIYEPGLEDIINRAKKNNKIDFTSDLKSALKGSSAIIIAVGTPTDEVTGRAHLGYVYEVAKEIANYLPENCLVITKSTVPPGTNNKIAEIIKHANPVVKFHIASNPEFLREGCAVNDFLKPDRILCGVNSIEAENILKQIYQPLTDQNYPLIFTDIATSELAKYCANAFLTVKVAFINEVADICEKVGADIEQVVNSMSYDKRIGTEYMKPGPGFGGSCFPKDCLEFINTAKQLDSDMKIINAAIESNIFRKQNLYKKIIANFKDKNIEGKIITILGTAFKAGTDDIRYSPALDLLPQLVNLGAILNIYDPAAINNTRKILNHKNFNWCNNLSGALNSSEALVILTEWDEFKNMNLEEAANKMRNKLIIDYRNILDAGKLKKLGFKYVCVGK